MEDRYQVFISYRRDGGEFLARSIRDRLEDKGFRVFFDVEALRSGDFNEALLNKIEECADFLLILPPRGLDRCSEPADWVRREVVHAMKHNKNIIPVLQRGFEWPDELPDDMKNLPNLNGVSASSEYFDAVIDTLIKKRLKSVPINGDVDDERLIEAADSGNVDAMNRLAIRYEYGTLTLSADRKKALEYYQKAAENNDPGGLFNLADVYEKCSRDLTLSIEYGIQETIKDRNPEKVRKGLRDIAVGYYQKSADLGFLPALSRLGNLAEEDREFERAYDYYTDAAEKGYPPALNAQGYYLYNGLLQKADQVAGIGKYQAAAAAGFAPAIYNYARAIEQTDLDKAISLLQSISYGIGLIPRAAYELGLIYEERLHDLRYAVIYYRTALEAGVSEAEQCLLRCQEKLFKAQNS